LIHYRSPYVHRYKTLWQLLEQGFIFRLVAVIDLWLVGIACHLILPGVMKLSPGRACTGI